MWILVTPYWDKNTERVKNDFQFEKYFIFLQEWNRKTKLHNVTCTGKSERNIKSVMNFFTSSVTLYPFEWVFAIKNEDHDKDGGMKLFLMNKILQNRLYEIQRPYTCQEYKKLRETWFWFCDHTYITLMSQQILLREQRQHSWEEYKIEKLKILEQNFFLLTDIRGKR